MASDITPERRGRRRRGALLAPGRGALLAPGRGALLALGRGVFVACFLLIALLALPLTAAAAPAQQSGDGSWYVVQRGDTLGQIALRHGTTIAALQRANGISNPNLIRVGQRLWIPGAAGGTPTAPPVATATPVASSTPTPEPGDGVWYTVRRGDTLGQIAMRYRTTSAAIMQANGLRNPNLIRVGQRLWIPGAAGATPAPTADPPTTPAPTETPSAGGAWYTVRSGDTLGRIAQRYGVTVGAIMQANKLTNANLIRVGQRLWIPGGSDGGGATPGPAPAPLPPSGSAGFAYGFQIQPWFGADVAQALDATVGAGFGWIKVQVPWKQFEGGGKGQYDWGELDRLADAVNARGLRLLVSVCKAPNWARSSGSNLGLEGPPANPQDLADFVGALAARYKGRVAAIEVWNEQNLVHEWGGEPLDAARYVRMLCASYQAIRAQDAGMIVVAGGLTPTGVNDGVTAIDDVTYLRSMYQAGCKSCMDALGVHPSGYNNPPSARMGYSNPAEPDFKAHPSFYFNETMTRYRQTMVAYGDSAKALWPTEFGWASAANPAAGYEYARDVTEGEQASYLVEALTMMRRWGYVGPAFVWNLNFNVSNPGTEMAQFGVLGRPAYDALRSMPK